MEDDEALCLFPENSMLSDCLTLPDCSREIDVSFSVEVEGPGVEDVEGTDARVEVGLSGGLCKGLSIPNAVDEDGGAASCRAGCTAVNIIGWG